MAGHSAQLALTLCQPQSRTFVNEHGMLEAESSMPNGCEGIGAADFFYVMGVGYAANSLWSSTLERGTLIRSIRNAPSTVRNISLSRAIHATRRNLATIFARPGRSARYVANQIAAGARAARSLARSATSSGTRAGARTAIRTAGTNLARSTGRMAFRASRGVAKGIKSAGVSLAFDVSTMAIDIFDMMGYVNPAYTQNVVYETVREVQQDTRLLDTYNLRMEEFDINRHPDLKDRLERLITMKAFYYALAEPLKYETQQGWGELDFIDQSGSPTLREMINVERKIRNATTGFLIAVLLLILLVT